MLTILLSILIIVFGFFVIKKYNKNANFCKNVNIFNNLYINNNQKYKFKNLSFSNTNQKLARVLNSNSKPFFFMNKIILDKDYYLTLSRFIDYKINFNKNKYRSKKNIILIESVANIISYNLETVNRDKIISTLKSITKNIKLRQKEIKVFKFLLGKRLLEFLAENLSQLFKISEIVKRSSKTKHIKKYKNQNHIFAQTYGIIKFHPNATRFRLTFKQNYSHDITMFFKELNCYKNKLNRTSHYLKIMFD